MESPMGGHSFREQQCPADTVSLEFESSVEFSAQMPYNYGLIENVYNPTTRFRLIIQAD